MPTSVVRWRLTDTAIPIGMAKLVTARSAGVGLDELDRTAPLSYLIRDIILPPRGSPSGDTER